MDLELKAPDAVEVIEQEKAMELIPLDKKELTPAIDDKTKAFVTDLLSVDPRSPDFDSKLENVYKLGTKEIMSSSTISNRMLDRPMAQNTKGSPQMKVAGDLGELRQQITELDPARADLKGVKKLLKWLPGGDKIDAYFNKYATAREHLDAINASLSSGQDELRRDNAAIDVYRNDMWKAMEKLKEHDAMLEQLDIAIVDKINEAEMAGNEELKTALETKALFAVRQRRTDIKTQAAVAVQGYFALEIVKKNNQELIRGVDRAQSTTMSAIQTAIIVAQALGVQEKVLAQITGLNATTGNVIESTSQRLREQGTAIQKQASGSMIEVQKLENAFQNVFAAMDELDTFKIQANKNFEETINSLQRQIDIAKPRMDKLNERNNSSSL